METNGIFFDSKVDMGVNNTNTSQLHSGQGINLHTFWNRLGEYNVYNVISNDKKMAAILIKLSFWVANLLGISLTVYWLSVDFDMIKGFLSGVGVVCYMGMKLYEKYLDIKHKRDNKTITPRIKRRNISANKK
jgi:hypothetical protein